MAFFMRRMAQHRALAAAATAPQVRAVHRDFVDAYEVRLALALLARPEAAVPARAELWL
ncbi:hypothetical protein [Sphingomonas changnyeongensis]|uniref:hypothetical protein n=1 Tax=Sphingomonas changnyeongensis TaxID=2698679 RepID=UPI001E418FCF|nr:hypothetical protein [Sphingomonas changnyeongensis]